MVSFRDKLVSLLSTLFTIYITAVDSSIEEIERHLENGQKYLSKGQYSDALTEYHAVLILDPDDYQSLFKRATCYLALGKSKLALSDLDGVVKHKPDFTSARLMRANLLLKQCDLEAAAVDYEKILVKDPKNDEANKQLSKIEPIRQSIEEANGLFERGDLSAAERLFSSIIEICPSNPQLHEKRAICYETMGDMHKAVSDIRSVAALIPDSTDAHFKTAKLYYKMGDVDQSLRQIRECLKLDPDHKACFPFYKNVKKLAQQLGKVIESVNSDQWGDCVDYANFMLKAESKVEAVVMLAKEHLCHCYSKENKVEEAIGMCNEVLNYDPTNSHALCDRAEAFIIDERFDEAIKDFQESLNKNEDNKRAKEGLDRAQKLLKQSKKKDYYKILNVKRNANKRQIMKAYRKLAQQWHPDSFKDEDKKMAQEKFIDIAAAKEVLTNEEKRKQFDSGVDPLDPESQQQFQQPFGHGFPFGGAGGGGPFEFKFHFQ